MKYLNVFQIGNGRTASFQIGKTYLNVSSFIDKCVSAMITITCSIRIFGSYLKLNKFNRQKQLKLQTA